MTRAYYREETLEAIARRTLTKYDMWLLNGAPKAVPIERIIEDVYKLELCFLYLTNNGRVLGKTIFDNGFTPYYDAANHRYELLPVKKGTMLIDASLEAKEQYGRLRFTEAHELAHWILHQEVYAGTGEAAALMSSDQDTATEWQANALATALLMPYGQIKRCFYALRAKYTDNRVIVDHMAELYGVSRQAMKIRLESKRLI